MYCQYNIALTILITMQRIHYRFIIFIIASLSSLSLLSSLSSNEVTNICTENIYL